MARFYLGIDGGQSSTAALLADETGRVIGHGRGGPCNHAASSEGRAKFFTAVGDCLKSACQEAGLDYETISFAAVCLGLSGGAEDKSAYARQLIRSQKYKITHDADIALTGGTGGEPGIIVIAGTGSIAYGRNEANHTARAGGWGYIFGDEGGAFHLVRQALRAALRYEEGWGPKTDLLRLLLAETGANSASELMHDFYGSFDRTRIATFAPLLDRAAVAKDEVSLDILAAAARQLTSYAGGVYRQLFRQKELVPIVYIGGVFKSGTLLSKFKRYVNDWSGCQALPPRLSPVAGALLQALRLDRNACPISDLAE